MLWYISTIYSSTVLYPSLPGTLQSVPFGEVSQGYHDVMGALGGWPFRMYPIFVIPQQWTPF